MSTYPHVSIIFPNYNGGKEPLECLSSIRKLNYPKNRLEIIIIDNNSNDGSDIKIQKKYSSVKLIKNEENLGFAKAVNIGIKKSHGHYVFITNDDIVFEKNSLKILVNDLSKDQSIGLIGGKIYHKKNPKKIISSGYMMNKWAGNIYPAPEPDLLKEPDWIQGCALLISKKLLLKSGLLDDNFNHYFEDFDLCLRVKKLGFKIVYQPEAVFWHGESLSANKDIRSKYYFWYRNKFRFILKNLPLINILSIFVIQILMITPYRLIILNDKRFFPTLRGLWWNILNIKHTLSIRNND